MKQLELAEVLFVNIFQYFERYKINREIPQHFCISFHKEKLNIHSLFSCLDSTSITQRIEKLNELCEKILNLWNTEIINLKPNGKRECFNIDENYRIQRKSEIILSKHNNWLDFHPNSEIFSFNRLMDYVIIFNEYYSEKLKREASTKKKDKIKEITLNDFFIDLSPEQIENIQKHFSHCDGIEMTCFIHQMILDGNLKIIKGSKNKNLTIFLKLFNPNAGFEGVRKQFNQKSTEGAFKLENESHLKEYKTKDKIEDALKLEVVVSNNKQL